MKKKIHAFTLAEALILLLIAALLAAALVPVITRKHKDVGEHGEWICTMNTDGKHVIKTTYRGKVTQFELGHNNGQHCIFSPPANAKNFTIKAVGGGGGGGGGTAGNIETVFDSRLADGENQVFSGSVTSDGAYSVIYGGGGGAGGGMACGEAKDQAQTYDTDFNLERLFDEEPTVQQYRGGLSMGTIWDMTNQKYNGISYLNNIKNCTVTSQEGLISCNIKSPDAVPNPKRTYPYGFADRPVPKSTFDYNLLKQNDKNFTDNYSGGKQDYSVKIYDTKGNIKNISSLYDVKYHYITVGGISDKTKLQNRAFCFAEKWDLSKEINGDKGLYLTDKNASNPSIKCWNLPGIGGKAAKIVSEPEVVQLSAGQSIYATVGQGGIADQLGESYEANADTDNTNDILDKNGNKLNPNRTVTAYLLGGSDQLTKQTKKGYAGAAGGKGGDTIINFGVETKIAEGADGGANRTLARVNFVNIPVRECRVEKTETQANNTYSYNCPSGPFDSSSTCSSYKGCKSKTKTCYKTVEVPAVTDEEGNIVTPATTKQEPYTCYSCTPQTHAEVHYYVSNDCVIAIRPVYFTGLHINACIYSTDIPTDHPKYGDFTKLDYPFFNDPLGSYVPGVDKSTDGEVENDIEVVTLQNRNKYKGNAGSGGYGAGELTRNYIEAETTGPGSADSFPEFVGDNGYKGFAAIFKSSAYGGTGGQAGQYISTMMKKIGKLEITIGRPGFGGGPSSNGTNGGQTIIKDFNKNENIYVLQGGMGGQGKKLNIMKGTEMVAGGDGSPSPVENESNRAKIVPHGGGSNGNGYLDGQTAATSVWAKGSAGSMPTTSYGYVGLPFTLNLVGGHPLDMTYGAGGGGGGGKKGSGTNYTGDNGAGNGGSGTPGAVIIKW